MLKVSEIYEKTVRCVKERPDGSEYITHENQFASRDCLINTDYIVAAYPYEPTSDMVQQRLDSGFPEGSKFSTLVVDGNSFRKSEILVTGSFEKFCSTLGVAE